MLVVDITKQLTDAHISGIDHIYPNNIPASAVNDVSATDVRVTELAETDEDDGSNKPATVVKGVSIDIFYNSQAAVSPDNVERDLLAFFMDNGWFRNYSGGHVIDPETKQVTKTMHFVQKFNQV